MKHFCEEPWFGGQGTLFWKNGNKRREGKWSDVYFISGIEYLEDGTKVYDGEFGPEYIKEEYGEEDENSDQE